MESIGNDDDMGDVHHNVSARIYIDRMKKELFALLMMIHKSRPIIQAQWILCIGMLIEYCQIIGLIFNNSTNPFPSSYTSIIQHITSVLDRGLWISSSTSNTYALYISSIYTCTILITSALLLYQHHHYHHHLLLHYTTQSTLSSSPSPQYFNHRKVYRILLRCFTSIGYIPILHSFCSATISSSSSASIHIIMGYIGGVITICITIIVVSCLYDMDWNCPSPFAQFNTLPDIMYVLLKTIIIVLCTYAAQSMTIQSLCIFIVCIPVIYHYIMYLPYYNMTLNMLRSSLITSIAWCGLCILIATLNEKQGGIGSFFMFVGAFPLIVLCTCSLCRLRLNYYKYYASIDRLENGWDIEIKVRLEYQEMKLRHWRQSNEANVRRGDGDGDGDDANVMDDKHRLEEMTLCWKIHNDLVTCTNRIQNASMMMIHVLLGHISFRYLHHKYLGYSHFETIELKNKSSAASTTISIPLQFHIQVMLDESKQLILENESNRHVVKYLEFIQHLDKAKQYDALLAGKLTMFWQEIMTQRPDIDKLRQLAMGMSIDIVQAARHYIDMNTSYSDSVVGLRWFAGFLTSLTQDIEVGDKILQRANELDVKQQLQLQRQRHDDNGGGGDVFRNSLFSERSGIISISAEQSKLGQIIDANDVFSQMFGYTKDSLIGRDVKMIMPEPFASHHSSMLQRNLSNGNSKFIDHMNYVAGRHRSGTIMLIRLFVKSFVHESKLSFLGIVEQVAHNDMIIVMDQDGLITGVSTPFILNLNINKDAIAQREIRIQQIIPQFNNDNDKNGLNWRRETESKGIFIKLTFIDGLCRNFNVKSNSFVLNESASSIILHLTQVIDDASNDIISVAEKTHKHTPMNDKNDDDEAGKHKVTTTPSITAAVKNSSLSALQRVEEVKHRKQEQMVLNMLRKSALAIVTILTCFALSALIMFTLIQSKHDHLLTEMQQVGERMYDLVSLSYYTRDLQLQNQGLIPTSIELEMNTRNNLLIYSNDLFTKNIKAQENRDMWNHDIEAAYKQLLIVKIIDGIGRESTVEMSLNDALVLVIGKVQLVYESELNKLNEKDEKVYFLLNNAPYVIASALQTAIIGYQRESEIYVKQLIELLFIFVSLSLSSILLLSMYALRPTITSVMDEKEQVFQMFFMIPITQVASNLLPKCRERSQLMSAIDARDTVNDENTMNDDVLNGEESNMKTMKNRSKSYSKASNSSKLERNREKFIQKSLSQSSHIRSGRVMQLMSRVVGILSIFTIYFTIYIGLTVDQVAQRSQFEYTLARAREQQFLVRRIAYDVREIAIHSWKNAAPIVSASAIISISEQLNFQRVILLLGDKTNNVPGTMKPGTMPYSIQLESICYLTELNDCETFFGGTANFGLQSALFVYSDFANNVAFNLGAHASTFAFNDSAVQNLLDGQHLEYVRKLDNDILRPALDRLVQAISSDMSALSSALTSRLVLFFVVFIIISTIVLGGVAQPLLTKLAWEFSQTRGLLKLVPYQSRQQLQAVKRQSVATNSNSKSAKSTVQILHRDDSMLGGGINASSTRAKVYGRYKERPYVLASMILLCMVGSWAIVVRMSGENFIDLAKDWVIAVFAIIPAIFMSIFTSLGIETVVVPVLNSSYNMTIHSIVDFVGMAHALALLAVALYFVLKGADIDMIVVERAVTGGAIGAITGVFLAKQSQQDIDTILAIVTSLWSATVIALVAANSSFRAASFARVRKDSGQMDFLCCGFVGGITMSLTGGGTGLLSHFFASAFYWVDDQVSSATAVTVMGFVSPIIVIARQFYGGPIDPQVTRLWLACGPSIIVSTWIAIAIKSYLSPAIIQNLMIIGALLQTIWSLLMFGSKSGFLLYVQMATFLIMTASMGVIGVGGAIMNFKNISSSEEKKKSSEEDYQ